MTINQTEYKLDTELDDLLNSSDDLDYLTAIQQFEQTSEDFKQLPSHLCSSLLPFQRDGVAFGIKKNGRCLIGDEMGLGKTLQAIGIAAYYMEEWPLLIVVPSSMKYVWLEEVQKWLPHLQPVHIHLVRSGEDVAEIEQCKITIVSYGLFSRSRFAEHLDKVSFKVVICDESHYIKNWKSQRTKHLTGILHKAQRRILLTGTPTLARPEELFPQVDAIAPGLFGKFHEFAEHFCQGHYNRRLKRYDTSGASNLSELHEKLTSYIMIRRLKSEVLTQLPPKRRQKISFDMPSDSMKDITASFNMLKELQGSSIDNQTDKINRAYMELYKLSGLVKIPACVEYVKELLKNNQKFLIFGHHIAVLDAIENVVAENGVGYIRIDGSVLSNIRQELVRQFQDNESCKVAILGIQAGGVGLTLTAASTVVFCELHWTPGVLLQAEDRVHRISQQNAVNIYYLIGLGTLDEMLWRKLNKKVKIVGQTLEGQSIDLGVEETKDDDIRDLLSMCRDTCPAGRDTKTKKQKNTSPKKQKSLALSSDIPLMTPPGQKTLSSFFSPDSDFQTPKAKKSSVCGDLNKILDKAQQRRDKMKMSVFNRRLDKVVPKKEKVTSVYFDRHKPKGKRKESVEKEDVIVLDSGSETDSLGSLSPKPKRSKRIKQKDKIRAKPVDEIDVKIPTSNVNKKSEEVNITEAVILDSDSSTESIGNISFDLPKVLSDTETNHPETTSPNRKCTHVLKQEDKVELTSEPISTVVRIDPVAECSTTVLPKSFEGNPILLSSDEDLFDDEHSASQKLFVDQGEVDDESRAPQNLADQSEVVKYPTNNNSDNNNDETDQLLTEEAKGDISSLKFSVSAHTHRVYIYDNLDNFLGENVLLQDIIDNTNLPVSLNSSPQHLQQALSFALEWRKLSKAMQASLYNKVIASVEDELKQLYSNRVVSMKRHTKKSRPSMGSISKKRKITIGGKRVDVEQFFTDQGQALCLYCKEVMSTTISSTLNTSQLNHITEESLSKLPFQGRFCRYECSQSYGIKSTGDLVRKVLFELELGVCQLCHLDTHQIYRQIKIATCPEEKVKILNKTLFKSLPDSSKRNMITNPTEGLFWQADHTIPVAEGGGECSLDNYRTLCTVCHKAETKALLGRLKRRREQDNMKKMGVRDIRTFMG